MTPADLLRTYADMADANRLTSVSPGGEALQQALSDFLRANADAEMNDIFVDLELTVARAAVAIILAYHGGRPCLACLQQVSRDLGRALGQEHHNHTHAQKNEGLH